MRQAALPLLIHQRGTARRSLNLTRAIGQDSRSSSPEPVPADRGAAPDGSHLDLRPYRIGSVIRVIR